MDKGKGKLEEEFERKLTLEEMGKGKRILDDSPGQGLLDLYALEVNLFYLEDVLVRLAGIEWMGTLWRKENQRILELELERHLVKVDLKVEKRKHFNLVEKTIRMMEKLCSKAKDYMYSVASHEESAILFGDILPRLKFHLNTRASISFPSGDTCLTMFPTGEQLEVINRNRQKIGMPDRGRWSISIPLNANHMETTLAHVNMKLSNLKKEFSGSLLSREFIMDQMGSMCRSLKVYQQGKFRTLREKFLVSLMLYGFEPYVEDRSMPEQLQYQLNKMGKGKGKGECEREVNLEEMGKWTRILDDYPEMINGLGQGLFDLLELEAELSNLEDGLVDLVGIEMMGTLWRRENQLPLRLSLKVEITLRMMDKLCSKAKDYMYSVASHEESVILFGDILQRLKFHLNTRASISIPSGDTCLAWFPMNDELEMINRKREKIGMPIICPIPCPIPGIRTIFIPLNANHMEATLSYVNMKLSNLEKEFYSSLPCVMEILDQMDSMCRSLKVYQRGKFRTLREKFLISLMLYRFEPYRFEPDLDRSMGSKSEQHQLPLGPLWENESTYTAMDHDNDEEMPDNSEMDYDEIRHGEEDSSEKIDFLKIRESYLKIPQIRGNFDLFWKLTCFPMKPEHFREEEQDGLEDLCRELDPLLQSGIQEYSDEVKEQALRSPSPESGIFFDVVELLPDELIKTNGDRVGLNPDSFKGKFVLVCCFNVPVLARTSRSFQSLANLCHELDSSREGDFQMIMVARMNSHADDKAIFDHFFSGLPRSCLAVPFEDKHPSEFICKVLGLDLVQGHFECLLVDGEGLVLPRLDFNVLWEYGAEAFPFSDGILDRKDEEMRIMVFEKKDCLESVLMCDTSSPSTLYKLSPRGEEKSIPQLSDEAKKVKKHVGIYLCSEGAEIPALVDICKKCGEDGLEFEVVVVYMPYDLEKDPVIFQGMMEEALKQHSVSSGWWCLPFNNSVSRRFLRLTKFYHNCDYWDTMVSDKLVVVGPRVGDHLDIHGLDVVRREHGTEAFPFSIDAAIKVMEGKMREVCTLETLIVDHRNVSVFRGNDSSDSRKLGSLLHSNANLFLCVDTLYHPYGVGTDYEELAEMYERTKGKTEGFEMVFVESETNKVTDEERAGFQAEMPWYICPIDAINSAGMDKFLGLALGSTLVGFAGEAAELTTVQTIYSALADSDETDDRISLSHTLYDDAEFILEYDDYGDHRMLRFKCPPRRVEYFPRV